MKPRDDGQRGSTGVAEPRVVYGQFTAWKACQLLQPDAIDYRDGAVTPYAYVRKFKLVKRPIDMDCSHTGHIAYLRLR